MPNYHERSLDARDLGLGYLLPDLQQQDERVVCRGDAGEEHRPKEELRTYRAFASQHLQGI